MVTKPGERKSIFIAALVVSTLAMTGNWVATAELSDQKDNSQAKRTRFLVLDSRIIDTTTDARLTLGKVKKDKCNPLFKEDKPWEPRFANLEANVLFDEKQDLYKCWYCLVIVDEVSSNTPREKRTSRYRPGKRETGICYAVSTDGIHWEKPELGLVEFNGSKKNNIVLRGPHGAGIFKDLREPDPAKRYKMFSKLGLNRRKDMMFVSFSPDGLHWCERLPCPQIDVFGDTHNNALWVPELDRYVAITRIWDRESRPRTRKVGWTSSKDFINWLKAKVVLEGLEHHLQIYNMPVFRYGGLYIGLPTIFNIETKRAHVELAWSEDTINWHRVRPGTPLIANAEKKGDYDWGCVYAAAYPVFLENEIRLYYGGSNNLHAGWSDGFFCLATLRPDGFAGYEPTTENVSAIITTKPVTFSGKSLHITADVQDGGAVHVSIVDEQGKELTESSSVDRTVTDGKVIWTDGLDFASLSDKKIRLKFVLHKAKLYSFSFK